MIKPILIYPNPVLKRTSDPISSVTDEVKQLAQDLIDTLASAPGVGISAPQIGVLKRVIVVLAVLSSSEPPKPVVMINPVMSFTGKIVKGSEGCLSFPDIIERIERFDIIQVEYLDLDGNICNAILQATEARCVQHEIDHLNGKLFIDKVSVAKRSALNKKLKVLSERT